MIKSIILEVLVAANSVPRATYIPPQPLEQQLFNSVTTQINVVGARVLKRADDKAADQATNYFAHDINAEVARRVNEAGYEFSVANLEKALSENPQLSPQIRKEVVDMRDAYSAEHTIALRPVHEHLTKNGATPFEATRRTHSVALKDDSSVATLLQIFSGASIEYKEEVFESMARDAALHALRARTKKESDFTFARFIGKTKGLATPQGESIREAVASLPQDGAYDANAAYFVHHPRMLSRAPFGDAMLEMARTYPLAHIIAEAHRTMRREDGEQAKVQEQILALGDKQLGKAELYEAITRIRQESREPVKIARAPYTPRVRETEAPAPEKPKPQPQVLAPQIVEPEYVANRVVLFGNEVHRSAMERFAEISPVPVQVYDAVSLSGDALNAVREGTLVVIYRQQNSSPVVSQMRREIQKRGALPFVYEHSNAERLLEELKPRCALKE